MMTSSRRTTGLVPAETNLWGADPRHKVTMPLRNPRLIPCHMQLGH